MSTEMLEREIAELKQRVAQLEEQQAKKPNRRWMEAVGMMKDCDLFPEAIRLGRELREKANREGH